MDTLFNSALNEAKCKLISFLFQLFPRIFLSGDILQGSSIWVCLLVKEQRRILGNILALLVTFYYCTIPSSIWDRYFGNTLSNVTQYV